MQLTWEETDDKLNKWVDGIVLWWDKYYGKKISKERESPGRGGGGGWFVILNRAGRVSDFWVTFVEKVTFEQRSEGAEDE